MHDLNRELDDRDVLGVFGDPYEPLTVSEIAEELGSAPQAVYKRLQGLAGRDLVQSKRVNGLVRVWWRQPTEFGPESEQAVTDRNSEEPPAETPVNALQQSEPSAPVRDALQASPISIAVFDIEGNVSFANERAETLLGLERSETPGERYTDPVWRLYHDDGTPMSLREHPIARVFETGEPSFGFEHWIELEDGTERWVWGNATPIAGEDDPVEYVVVGFADVTPLKEREDKLTSDKRRVLELSSKQLFAPFREATSGPFRVSVDDVVWVSDTTALEYITASGISTTVLTDAIRRREGVQNVRLLRSTGDSCSLELRVASPTIPLVFDEFDGTVISLAESTSGETPTLTAELPGDVNPREALRATRELYPDIELESQELRYSPRLLYDIVKESMTERKFAVLQTAYYGGYFETPRQSSGDELANQLGITRQTYNQHLRKAEQLVFEQLFEASAQGKT